MALTSKGRPQHKCDCVANLDWNNGWIPTETTTYTTIIRAENDDGIIEYYGDTHNRAMHVKNGLQGQGGFDTIKFQYVSNSEQPTEFYIKGVCIKLNDSNSHFVPVVKNTFGGQYSDSNQSSLTGQLTGFSDGIFQQKHTRFGTTEPIQHGAEYYIVLDAPINYYDVASITWEYFLNDPSGVVEMQFSQNYAGEVRDGITPKGKRFFVSIEPKWQIQCSNRTV